MAFTVSGLVDFVKEEKTDLLIRSLFSSKTAGLIQAAGNIIPGIKSSEKLPILESTIYMQADGCGYTASGGTTITQREITVGKVKIEETLCPKTLNTKYLQKYLAAGSEIDLGVFGKQIGDEKAATIADLNEIQLWQGDVGHANPNLTHWNGFNTILDDLGFGGAGDPIEGNPSTGGSWTQQTAIDSTTIDECLDKVWSLIPERVKSKGDVVCFLSIEHFDEAILNIKAANLYHYNPQDEADMTIMWPGSRMKLIAIPGMTGLDTLIAGRIDNFYIGTDMMNEEEDYKMWYSEDNDEVRFRATYKYGCQIAFPAEVVYFQLP